MSFGLISVVKAKSMKTVNRSKFLACAGALALVGTMQIANAITIDVSPSSAPNAAAGGSSWSGYVVNAVNAIENGLTSVGNLSTDPTAYLTKSTFSPDELMVTSYNSWMGQASPSAPFAGEYGNRIHFGLHILGNGTQFRLSNLAFDMASAPANDLIWSGDWFSGYSYSARAVGINYGADGIKGTGDDIRYTSGSATALIDELIYVGVGNALWPRVPADGATEQAALDNVASYIWGNIGTFTTTYTLYADDHSTVLASGSGTANIPDASTTLGLLGFAVVGLGALRRKLSV